MTDVESFKIRPGIVEIIAGIALSGVEGVTGIGMRGDHPEDLKKRKNLSKGIRVEVEEEGEDKGEEKGEDKGEKKVSLSLDVIMDYGRDFNHVGRCIQGEIKRAVESMTGWNVVAVDVNVVGVNAS